MNDLIDRDLQEILGGDTPPDLLEGILVRASTGDPFARISEPRSARLIVLRLVAAACVILTLGVTGWLMWPHDPAGVKPSESAQYVVRADYIELNSGWLLLDDAPPVHRDSSRVLITGRGVVGPAIPGQDALDSLVDELGLSAQEEIMLRDTKRWLTAAGLALCLFSGEAVFNGETIQAGDPPAAETVEDFEEGGDGDNSVRNKAQELLSAIAEAKDAKAEAAAVGELTKWLEERSYSVRIYDRLDFQTNASGPNFAIEWEQKDLEEFSNDTEARFFAIAIANFPPQDQPTAGVTFKDNANIGLLLRVLADEVEIPEPTDIDRVRELMRTVVRIEVMLDGKMIVLGGNNDVTRIVDALSADGLVIEEVNIKAKHQDRLTMYLPDGRQIDALGLSLESDRFELRLPGHPYRWYTLPGKGADVVLKEYFDRARDEGLSAKWKQAKAQMARVQSALSKYKLEHGEYPQELSAVDEILARESMGDGTVQRIDPFTNEDFMYEPTEMDGVEGFELTCLGEDLVEGGIGSDTDIIYDQKGLKE